MKQKCCNYLFVLIIEKWIDWYLMPTYSNISAVLWPCLLEIKTKLFILPLTLFLLSDSLGDEIYYHGYWSLQKCIFTVNCTYKAPSLSSFKCKYSAKNKYWTYLHYDLMTIQTYISQSKKCHTFYIIFCYLILIYTHTHKTYPVIPYMVTKLHWHNGWLILQF